MQENQNPNTPFLLATATLVRSEEDQVTVDPSLGSPENEGNWFHTRCGHPRHRDD